MPLQWQSRSCDFSFCPFGHIPFKSPRLVMRDNLLYATANLETTGLKLFFLDAQTSFDQQFMSRPNMRNYHNCEKTRALSVLFRASFSASKCFAENAPLQPELVVPAPTLEVRLPPISQSGSALGRRASCPTIFEATMPPSSIQRFRAGGFTS